MFFDIGPTRPSRLVRLVSNSGLARPTRPDHNQIILLYFFGISKECVDFSQDYRCVCVEY